MIRLCGTMAELDFGDSFCKVFCPVLIVYGEKDNANKKASKELAGYLSDSCFHELAKRVMKQTKNLRRDRQQCYRDFMIGSNKF